MARREPTAIAVAEAAAAVARAVRRKRPRRRTPGPHRTCPRARPGLSAEGRGAAGAGRDARGRGKERLSPGTTAEPGLITGRNETLKGRSLTNISRLDVSVSPHVRDLRLDWAAWWIAQGAKVFLVIGGTKRPYGNCARCDFTNGAPHHDMATCPCLLCHGFHAATGDFDRFAAMHAQHPDGDLAIATGRVVVLDVESNDRLHPGRPYGVDVLDHWDEWTHWELASTLTATTPSGGFHLYYTSDEPVPTGRVHCRTSRSRATAGSSSYHQVPVGDLPVFCRSRRCSPSCCS